MSDELRAATERAYFRQQVDLFVTMIGLAVETHGDILRHALSQVFDLGAVEAHERENAARIAGQDERLQRIIEALGEVEKKLKRISKRLEEWERSVTIPI